MSGYEYGKRRDLAAPEVAAPQDHGRFEQPYGNAALQEQLRAVAPDTGNDIEICRRVAELPVAYQLGLQHWWIRTPELEVGMGPATGEVPAVDGDQGDLPFAATTVNDHTGQGQNPNATCVPAAEWDPEWDNVDRTCVENVASVGTHAGPWTPLFNDCHDWVEQTMDACDPDVQRRKEASDVEAEQEYSTLRFLERTHPGRY